MKQLKTLKDIPAVRVTNALKAMDVISNNNLIREEELRKETIEWIKKIKKQKITDKVNKDIVNHFANCSIEAWIKNFFNLTEGDLK